MTDVRPFKIDVPDEKISQIMDRVATYRWFDPPEGPPWARGMSTDVLKDVVQYWQTQYDWRLAEATLNEYPQFMAEVDGLDIHFVHIVGEAGGQRPLLITHGWPGSVYEFWDAIGPLAFPSKHGGSPADAFDLIVPSLPGYGFSGKPANLMGPRATAGLWDKLMREVLGYGTYLAQGGDWGSMVTSWLGYEHGTVDGKGGCRAIHLNMLGLRPTPATPQSDAEAAWLSRTRAGMQLEGAYFMEQSTKPQTLAMALMDTPVGQAAWILEKFHGWSQLSDDDLWSVYSRDQLLTNLMIYLVNDAIATSVWYYRAFMEEGGAGVPEGTRCETPTGFANFPGELVFSAPPRSWTERAYNITHWEDMPHGGHFAAMEAPDLFVGAVRRWAESLG
ncbi:MAG: epoxide hydrolase family protein [Pseudomonadota bacterium]